ncbi:hypothetical protein [Massilia phyllosphaerae]|uniref:hypothetical protein n=1 Tax=Massilia phyllosphaerae TaxID=3106034 RepID=UPI002B1CBD07|nr:hypothetical protein [Massilia sp. SGZ-792]
MPKLSQGDFIRLIDVDYSAAVYTDWLNSREAGSGDIALVEEVFTEGPLCVVCLLCEPREGFLEWRASFHEAQLTYELLVDRPPYPQLPNKESGKGSSEETKETQHTLPESPGIDPSWPTRKAVIQRLRDHLRDHLSDHFPRTNLAITQYNARLDTDNPVNVVENISYVQAGHGFEAEAIALAMEGKSWLSNLAQAADYLLFAYKLDFFWHENFRKLYPDHPHGLHLFSVKGATEAMAYAMMLGWKHEAVYCGYLIHAALNRQHYLILSYENEHRRAHAFMLRLFADWMGDVSHHWPPYAYDDPIYNGLIAHWRKADAAALLPWLIAACDRHTHQARREKTRTFYDFGTPVLARLPIEIVFLLRLRKLFGLDMPVIDHPLMAAPFDQLPEPQPQPEPNEQMQGTLARAREDWPMFDRMNSLETIKALAGSGRNDKVP